jgi:hypothetical protein
MIQMMRNDAMKMMPNNTQGKGKERWRLNKLREQEFKNKFDQY